MKAEILRFVDLGLTKPLDYAKMWYGLYCQVPFEQDLAEYLRNGCVVARPTCFMMFRPANIAEEGYEEEIVWYVRFAYGDLRELLNAFPAYLPKLAFYRAGFGRPKDNRLRVCSYDRMVRLAELRAKRGQEDGE